MSMKRLLMALVLCVLIPAAANFPAHSQSADKGKVTQSEQASARQNMTPIPPLIRQTKPDIYLPDCTRPKDHDQADLCQQMEMAKAADYAAKVAYRQYAVSIWGLAGLVLTVLLTFLAARAARDAASAAQASAVTADKTLKTMEGTAKAQLRAYVAVTRSQVEGFGSPNVRATVELKNSGITPAYALRRFIGAFVGPYPFIGPFPVVVAGDHKSILGPGNDVLLGPVALVPAPTAAQATGIAAGNLAIYVLGVVVYKDAFEEERTTTFRLYFRGNGVAAIHPGSVLGLMHCEEGNDAT